MLIFVHGMSSHAGVWSTFISFFVERGFSCEAVDLKEGLNLRKVRIRDYVDKVKALVTVEKYFEFFMFRGTKRGKVSWFHCDIFC